MLRSQPTNLPVLNAADPIEMVVIRGGERVALSVVPELIDNAAASVGSCAATPLGVGGACVGEGSKPSACAVHETSLSDEPGTGSYGEEMLGMTTTAPDTQTARRMGLATRMRTEGRVLTSVQPGGAASRAGLRLKPAPGVQVLPVPNMVLLRLTAKSRCGDADFSPPIRRTARPGGEAQRK